MRKLPLWTWVLIALIVADLLLAVTGTGILMAQQRGHGWAMTGGAGDVAKRRIPVLGCVYWTGLGTRLTTHPVPQPDQACPLIAR